MKPTITIESQRGPLGEYLLVSVTNGMGVIGICDTTISPRTSRETFYVETESLINIYSASQDASALRQIWQCSSIDKCSAALRSALNESIESYFYESGSLSRAVQPVLEMLSDGLYVVHTDKVYPTDGAGNFFWNAYMMRHELNGSARSNPMFGQGRTFSPPFIVPTRSCAAYTDKNAQAAAARLKRGRRLGGIAYHLTGMFSALLCGHINAAACLLRDVDFPCIIIEPLNGVMYTKDEETGTDFVSGLSCPFVNIPITSLSRNMLECFLVNRRCSVPEFYDVIRNHSDKVLQAKNTIKEAPPLLFLNAEKMPDAEMLASAFAVDGLSEEQLQMLLSGETKMGDSVIISANYYESIVYACNYLQYTDQDRFIDFTVSILNSPSLSAVYHYVAERVRYTMDARINEIFNVIINSDEPHYIPLKDIASKYIKRYGEYMEQSVKRFLDDGPDLHEIESAAPPIPSLTGALPPPDKTGFSSLALQQELERSKPAPKHD